MGLVVGSGLALAEKDELAGLTVGERDPCHYVQPAILGRSRTAPLEAVALANPQAEVLDFSTESTTHSCAEHQRLGSVAEIALRRLRSKFLE